MNAKDVRKFQEKITKNSKKNTLNQFTFLEKLYVIFTCGRINQYIEKKAKEGYEYIKFTMSPTMARRFYPFMIKCYEEEGYRVCLNQVWERGRYNYILYFFWNEAGHLPVNGNTIYYTGGGKIVHESNRTSSWYEEVMGIIESMFGQ